MFLTKGLSKVGNDFPDVYCNRNNHMDHSFSTYAKFYKKLTFLTPWYARIGYAHVVCVSGGKNATFMEDIEYALKEWSGTLKIVPWKIAPTLTLTVTQGGICWGNLPVTEWSHEVVF